MGEVVGHTVEGSGGGDDLELREVGGVEGEEFLSLRVGTPELLLSKKKWKIKII